MLALVTDPTIVAAIASAVGVIVSAAIGYAIARQARKAQHDVAQEEAEGVWLAKREEVQADAYNQARRTLSETIADQDRIMDRLRARVNDAEAAASACAERVQEQSEQIETLQSNVRHLTNQDNAKGRIIEHLREELHTAQAALRQRFPDEP